MSVEHDVRTSWYGFRTLPMPDEDERGIDSILIWIERREGGVWAVGRASDLAQRDYSHPRASDYIFEGYEITDALEAANAALEDDLQASEMDGIDDQTAKPFTRRELEEPLNDWFWGRRAV